MILSKTEGFIAIEFARRNKKNYVYIILDEDNNFVLRYISNFNWKTNTWKQRKRKISKKFSFNVLFESFYDIKYALSSNYPLINVSKKERELNRKKRDSFKIIKLDIIQDKCLNEYSSGFKIFDNNTGEFISKTYFNVVANSKRTKFEIRYETDVNGLVFDEKKITKEYNNLKMLFVNNLSLPIEYFENRFKIVSFSVREVLKKELILEKTKGKKANVKKR